MKILIEEYPYNYDEVSHVLKGLTEVHDAQKRVSVHYVGYYFNPELTKPDCVFILPKVLLEKDKEDGREKVFGHIEPVDLIDAEGCESLTDQERKFLYNLSVWVYRAISVFKDHEYDRRRGKKKDEESIVLYRQAPIMGRSKMRKANTFLDVLLALLQWNRDNKQFVMFTLKNLHSGFNKINWTKTISHTQAFMQDGVPIYMNPVNKKRKVNFDEELLVIFFSILRHIHDLYGFPVDINVNFPLITGKKFERYINGYGKTRLRQIKYKYFSDKSLELWNLCFAFFDKPNDVTLTVDQKEYLLVKSFHVVFEAIIDELIAGDQELPNNLKDQEDGKRVDHMYMWQQLVNNEKDENIYYIGDSKYYKRGHELGYESVYKQFTYARNVVQWNLDLFNDGTAEEQRGHVKLRDDVTEGYNIIPNFFISAHQKSLVPDDRILLATDRTPYHLSRQFENRLFDRDTFLLAHYDVDFLFVLALYGRNNASAKADWRKKARTLFRKEIQEMLKKHFLFFAMTAHEEVDPENYIQQHFQTLLGKVFQPFENRGSQEYFSLALRDPEKIEDERLKAKISEENEAVRFQLEQAFYIEKCPLGEDPRDKLPMVEPRKHSVVPHNLLTVHYLEKYPETSFLIGGFSQKQLKWMFGRQGGKRDDAYNVRIGRDVKGGVLTNREEIKHAKFVLLYEFEKEHPTLYKVFRVNFTREMTKDQMIKTGYEEPHHERYFCYFFDEEVNIGMIDIEKIINLDRVNYNLEIRGHRFAKDYPEGRPIYLSGSELLKFRTSL